ncbi:hypothetical protein [Streptomyces misionensis]|uniref:hypothetical protein n=1 Tax=Streptomyces misionensis TaxID=67331 RepID=UPI0033EFA92A
MCRCGRCGPRCGGSPARDQLRAWGIKVIYTTLTPCHGYAPCTTDNDADRADANTRITDQTDYTTPTVTYTDAEQTVAIPDPTSTADAYHAISDTLDLTTLGPDA